MKKIIFILIFLLLTLFLFNPQEKELTLNNLPTLKNELTIPLADWQKLNSDVIYLLEFQNGEEVNSIPVVYKESDPEFYFRKALDLSYSSMGTAFVDRHSSLDSLNLIINAHSSKEKKSHFTFLKKYADQAYFNQHSEFKLISSDETYLCTVLSFSEYDLSQQETEYIWYLNPKNKKDLFNLLELTKPYQIHQNQVDFDFERIITLVTCNMDKEDSRYVLQASLKKEEDDEKNNLP